MDTITIQFIGTWAVVFACCAVVAVLCQKLENYIKSLHR